MSKKYKIGICGHFGNGRELLNGQTIKTKNVADALIREFSEDKVLCVDTHGGVKAALRLSVQTFYLFFTCRNIIFLPARRALLVLVPLFSFYNLFFHRSLHYIVIGGWLPGFLKKHKWLYGGLKRMKGIYVETEGMKTALEETKLENVYLMRNFRTEGPLDKEELIYTWKTPYPVCTFSRVVREKGIEDAVKAVKFVNKALAAEVFRLDIYGMVEPAYRSRFKKLEKDFPDYIRYAGSVSAGKSREIVKGYYALLFPTFCPSEGFPGTLIDAMNAGVPVIASDWNYNCEAVIPGRTGILFPSRDPGALIHALYRIAMELGWWNSMKLSCLEEAGKYAKEQVIGILLENLK